MPNWGTSNIFEKPKNILTLDLKILISSWYMKERLSSIFGNCPAHWGGGGVLS